MRRDHAVGRGKKRVVRRGRLTGEHIQPRAAEPAGLQRLGHRRFIQKRAPARVDQPTAGLHLLEGRAVDQVPGLVGQRAVEGQGIDLRQQRVDRLPVDVDPRQRDVVHAALMPGRDGHAHRRADLRHPLADLSQPDDAQRFAGQLRQRRHAEGEILAPAPLPVMHRPIVGSRLHDKLQKQGKHVLGHRIAAVAGDVGHRDARFAGRSAIDHVHPRRQYADVFEIGRLLDRRRVDRGLVGQHDLGLADRLDHRLAGEARIDRQLAKLLEPGPGRLVAVAGLARLQRREGVAVQHDNPAAHTRYPLPGHLPCRLRCRERARASGTPPFGPLVRGDG